MCGCTQVNWRRKGECVPSGEGESQGSFSRSGNKGGTGSGGSGNGGKRKRSSRRDRKSSPAGVDGCCSMVPFEIEFLLSEYGMTKAFIFLYSKG